ncbi:MAG: hypothetical protein NTZ55_00130 [Candidatus Roizmanbacteria bacterium]|nr:hypothetical protein [Candidatus Roizmanbacteria bacterium]
MTLPKSITTVTTFSKMLAALLFIVCPLIGFQFGISYQRGIDTISGGVKVGMEKKTVIQPTPTPSPISSPSKIGWNRYMSKGFDYYIDYPKTYWYGIENKNSVSFEKMVNDPHRTSCWIFIDSSFLSQVELDELKQMGIGEAKVIAKKESSIPSKFKTFERLPDELFGTKNAKSFVNRNVWEGDHMYVYIYEEKGKTPYIFGGFTSENKDSKDKISYLELKEIVSTLRFLE